VETVGIDLGQPGPGGVLQGVINIRVSVNEGARVRTIALEVDGQEVNRVDVQGLRAQSLQPQAITYTIPLDTAALGTDGQPRFRNGTRTLTVKVTDAQGNTKSATTQSVFRNPDRVRGIVVEQTDNPKAPATRGGIPYYGNGDPTVRLDIVNYSGATYTLATPNISLGVGNSVSIAVSGGAGGELRDLTIQRDSVQQNSFGATLNGAAISGQPAFRLPKASNNDAEGLVQLKVLQQGPTNSTALATLTFGLDNKAPTQPSLEAKRVTEVRFNSVSGEFATSTRFRGNASDTGVAGITYTLRLTAQVGTEQYEIALPKNLAGVVSKVYDYTLIAEDALGNRSSPSRGTLTVADRTFSVTVTNANQIQANYDAGQRLNFGSALFNVQGQSPPSSQPVQLVLAIRQGNNLLPLVEGQNQFGQVRAAHGVEYAVVAVDGAGNFAVLPLNFNIAANPADATPPTLSVNNSTASASSYTITGTVQDNVATSNGRLVAYVEAGSAGGFTLFAYADKDRFTDYPTFPNYGEGSIGTTPTSFTLPSQSFNITGSSFGAPPDTRALRVVAVDGAFNATIASATVTVP